VSPALLRAALGLAYPLVVFLGLRYADARTVALLLAGVFIARGVLGWHRPSWAELRRILPAGIGIAAVLAAAALWNDPTALFFVPVAINAVLLYAFGRTLLAGPPLVETFARLQDPELSPAQVRHCRNVTIVWCAFFLCNGAVSLALAILGDVTRWALYTGLVAYLLMGVLFAAEFLVRAWRFDTHVGTFLEPVLRPLLALRRRPTS